MGDLIATSIHIYTNKSVDLFNRPGRTIANALGYGIDFNGNYSFNDAYSGNLWATEEVLPSNGVRRFRLYYALKAGSKAEGRRNLFRDFIGNWLSVIDKRQRTKHK